MPTDLEFALGIDGLRGTLGRWSVHAVDESGRVVVSVSPSQQLSTASVGKLLRLIEVARLLQLGRADSGELLLRDESARAFDSGIWQYLEIDRLPLADVARLVGIASDNWATNVLLSRVGGVVSLAATAAREAIHGVVLHDRVRDARHLSDPDALSTGSASAYVELLWRLHRGTVVDASVSAQVIEWLRGGFDLSMVASTFNLDPLSHARPGSGVSVLNKTGTDLGVRADVGVVSGPRSTVAYAVIANWNAAERASTPELAMVLASMRRLGLRIRGAIGG